MQAVFNYEFDSLTHDDPVIVAVYTALREAEYRWGGWDLAAPDSPSLAFGQCLSSTQLMRCV